jgi:uncharacterized damage-inducible protein DinB
MDSVHRLQRLFDYDEWATRKIVASLEAHPELKKRDEALKLLGHLLSAQQIWHRRTVGKDFDDLELWPTLSLEKCKTILNSMSSKWFELLKNNKKNPDILISYKNTKGEAYETLLSDILHHLIIHGQHHRAQIATLISESEVKPPTTDFIYYTRSTK